MPDKFSRFAAAMREQLGPEYPECYLALIDALRDYLRNDSELAELVSGLIKTSDPSPHILRCQELLKELEAHNLGQQMRVGDAQPRH
jgi:hypothetical protein